MEAKMKDLGIILQDCATSPHPSTFALLEKVFENKLVLDTIFQKLEASPTGLKKCRLVSQDWKQLATERLQKKNWNQRNFIDLRTDEKMEKYLDTISTPLTSPEEQLFSCFRIERSMQCRKYDQDLMHRFFEVQNQQIKSMSLGFDFHSMEQFEKLISSQATSLKELRIQTSAEELGGADVDDKELENDESKLINLNHLCIKLADSNLANLYRFNIPFEHIPDAKIHNVMKMVLKRIPPKKSLKLCLIDWDKVRKTIPILRKYGQIENLKVFEMSRFGPGHLNQGELKLLSDAGVHLQFLGLEPAPIYGIENELVNGIDVELSREVFAFLRTQTNNLEMLSWGSHFKFKFPPCMKVLKKLRLNCERFSEDAEADLEEDENHENENINAARSWNRSCGPILYEYTFPELEELELIGDCENSLTPAQFLNWFLQPQSPCVTLKKFSIDYPEVNLEILRAISNTFPRITSLKFDYKEELAESADASEEMNLYDCLWRSEFSFTLQELSIALPHSGQKRYGLKTQQRNKYELDSFFSGLSVERISEISTSGVYKNKDFTLGHQGEDRSSLLNFKSLRKLVIHIPQDYSSVKRHFTDFSAFAIFGKMSDLKFLHLDEEIRDLSPQALDYLKYKLSRQPVCYPLGPEERIDEIFQTGFHNTGSGIYKPKNLINLLDVDINSNDQCQNEVISTTSSVLESGTNFGTDDSDSFTDDDDTTSD